MKKFLKSVLTRSLGVVALVLVGVMIYSATSGGFATIPETLTGLIVTPIQTLATSISNGVSGFFGDLTGGDELRQQLEQLQKENAELRQQLVDYDELKQTNDWYSEILGLHEENPEYTFAAGRVIARDPADFYGNFTISAGSHSDISVNDPVVSTDGSLVGVVEEVGLTYSKVRTILDPSTKVAAQISRTGDTAYTAGSTVEMARQNSLRLTTLERSSGASAGDYVVTSGIGGVYPSGLLIGSVQQIRSATDGMTLDADIDLFADIYNLKQVMVITSFAGQGGQ
ncbi:MAG: rod shape-determining protein MreC [Clostridia bacterium]|nr:rod shape-determining protein MreC [Clostridia bacterium]